MKKYLRIAVICIFCGAVFLTTSYFYLYIALEKGEAPASESKENVPYYDIPENCGLTFYMPSGSKITFFLDFEKGVSYIIYMDDNYDILGDYIDFAANYEIALDYTVLSFIIDRLGGIDLENENEILRYTGIQVCDALSDNPSLEYRRAVLKAVCRRICTEGYSEDDFVFLIESTGSNLPLISCIAWQDYIPRIFANAVFNWEY